MRLPGGSLAILVRPAAIVAVAGSVDCCITVLGPLSLGHHEEGRIKIASFRSTRPTTIDCSTPKCAGGCFRKCVVDACRGGRDRGTGRVQSCSRAFRSEVSGGKKFANWQVAVRSGRLLVLRRGAGKLRFYALPLFAMFCVPRGVKALFRQANP